jgi:hypothetical protein
MNTVALAPGWYTDKTDPALLRFWNGTAWSAHTKPRPGLPTSYQAERQRSHFGVARRIR